MYLIKLLSYGGFNQQSSSLSSQRTSKIQALHLGNNQLDSLSVQFQNFSQLKVLFQFTF